MVVRTGLVAALGLAVLGGAARATDAPVIVIPGKAGVPVIINGYDASYAVVEGDWGLDRPGHVPATIVTGPLVVPRERYPASYFPASGRQPGYGRREIEPPPNRKLPPPAPSYERFWGAESMPLPPSVEQGGQRADVNVDPDDDGGDNQGDRSDRGNQGDRANQGDRGNDRRQPHKQRNHRDHNHHAKRPQHHSSRR